MTMAFTFALDAEQHAVSIAARRPQLSISVDGVNHAVSESSALNEDCVRLTVDGRSYQVWRTWEGDRIHLRIAGRSFSVGYQDPVIAAHAQAGGDAHLRADMPGVVVEVRATSGSEIVSGDILMVIESMKMQINIVAPRNGVIETIHVEVNQTFDKGHQLISLREED